MKTNSSCWNLLLPLGQLGILATVKILSLFLIKLGLPFFIYYSFILMVL